MECETISRQLWKEGRVRILKCAKPCFDLFLLTFTKYNPVKQLKNHLNE